MRYLSLSLLWRSVHSTHHLQLCCTTDTAYTFSRPLKRWYREEQDIHITDIEHDTGDVDAYYLGLWASGGLTEAHYSETIVQGLTAASL